jgi:3-phenylpropionate/cinnamic acid dioxygenase small subunit
VTGDVGDYAALVERVRWLEAERDIRDVLVGYAESLDYGHSRAWAECFTPEGRFEVRLRGEPLFAHTGAEALAAFAAQHTHAPDVYHKHFLSVPTIKADGPEQASARTYFTMLHERPAGPIVLVIGRYLDELVRLDGRWLFDRRVVDMEALPPQNS